MRRTGAQLTGERKKAAKDILDRFVCLFRGKGWLDRPILLQNGGTRYRLFCSENRFFAYRMNESWGISPGVPGWPVCMVTQESLFHDGSTCAIGTEEPETDEWLRLLNNADSEVAHVI